MMDSGCHTRTPAEDVQDQYADGKAAKIWEVFIGDKQQRTQNYRDFLVGLLQRKGCRRILDVACGTGIDSVMLLEEGFEVISIDASDKMLKYALKYRWDRRKESAFDNWGEQITMKIFKKLDKKIRNNMEIIFWNENKTKKILLDATVWICFDFEISR